jgi:uncharacterized OB-fold protein
MMTKQIPVREGLYSEEGGGKLLANKCEVCGRIYFPKTLFCFDCLEKTMEDVVLSRRGKLYSYTIGRMPSGHFQPPYGIGLVDLPEGLRVFAPLAMTEDETLKVGMEMEVSIEELWQENDQHIIGYKFRPVEPAV